MTICCVERPHFPPFSPGIVSFGQFSGVFGLTLVAPTFRRSGPTLGATHCPIRRWQRRFSAPKIRQRRNCQLLPGTSETIPFPMIMPQDCRKTQARYLRLNDTNGACARRRLSFVVGNTILVVFVRSAGIYQGFPGWASQIRRLNGDGRQCVSAQGPDRGYERLDIVVREANTAIRTAQSPLSIEIASVYHEAGPAVRGRCLRIA